MIEQIFDYTGWQERMRFTNAQAAHALDVSESFYGTLKRNARGRKLYAWAAYGIEMAECAAKGRFAR